MVAGRGVGREGVERRRRRCREVWRDPSDGGKGVVHQCPSIKLYNIDTSMGHITYKKGLLLYCVIIILKIVLKM